MAQHTPEADIILVGGGAASCVIAGRLSAAAPALKILVLERGPHTLDDPLVRTPGLVLNHLLPTSPRTLFYAGAPSEHLAGETLIVPTGGCVGGGSAINFMMYTRGAASDYDDWAHEHGNPGWAYKDLAPLFEKTETYVIDPTAETHGASGPIQVTYGGASQDGADEWIAAGHAYDNKPIVPDSQNFKTIDGYTRWPKWVAKSGKRSDAAHGFLYPQAAKNPNLTIVPHALVSRVLFEGKKAVGVEYSTAGDGAAQPTVHTARAAKLVVLCAGALGTPQVLERSGVGAPAVLSAAGVPVVYASPGVGEHYQDHNLLVPFFFSGAGDDRDAFLRGEPEVVKAAEAQYAADGTGLLSAAIIDAGIKVRGDPAKLGRVFESAHWAYFARAPDKAVFWSGFANGILLPGGAPGKYFGAGAYTNYPLSRGRIHIRSRSASDAPAFDLGFLSHPADLPPLVYAYKHMREIARRMPRYRGELPSTHPTFAPGSAAAAVPAEGPVAQGAPDIVYSAEDEAALEEWVRKNVRTTWHSMGTCAMKPFEQGGVVDARLNVYGVHDLKVADLSICPSNVGANTYSTALVIGEKAAVIIGEELGISGV